ncbi:MAG: class I SAM-dependent methyltransferase [Negativicutes bacterium]|nr:class I SAM-dependent methyltransferase [Negativicutes bacterium]
MTTIAANAVEMAQRLLTERLPAAGCAVDATAGNGRDTLFLAKKTAPHAQLWAFDIQTSALANTQKLLVEHGLADKVRLVHDCHSRIASHIQGTVDIVMYNLGYLPGGDRALTTGRETTIASLTGVLPQLALGGLITVVAYPGYPAGRVEHEAVRLFLAALPQNEFTVGCWSMLNQRNDPPLLYIIQRIRGELA